MIETLKPKQQKAIQMLLEGKTIQDITADLHIERNTLWRWKQEPLFISEYNRLNNAINKGIKNKHQELMVKSLKVLEEILDSGTDQKQKILVALAVIKAHKSIPEAEENPEKIETIQGRKELEYRLDSL